MRRAAVARSRPRSGTLSPCEARRSANNRVAVRTHSRRSRLEVILLMKASWACDRTAIEANRATSLMTHRIVRATARDRDRLILAAIVRDQCADNTSDPGDARHNDLTLATMQQGKNELWLGASSIQPTTRSRIRHLRLQRYRSTISDSDQIRTHAPRIPVLSRALRAGAFRRTTRSRSSSVRHFIL